MRAAYQAIANTGTAEEQRPFTERVRALHVEISATIAAGAEPCPSCGIVPHGMEQPTPNGSGIEYEIGCRTCRAFQHTDGTVRDHRVRGGLLPRHAVEAWNAGPDHWMLYKERT